MPKASKGLKPFETNKQRTSSSSSSVGFALSFLLSVAACLSLADWATMATVLVRGLSIQGVFRFVWCVNHCKIGEDSMSNSCRGDGSKVEMLSKRDDQFSCTQICVRGTRLSRSGIAGLLVAWISSLFCSFFPLDNWNAILLLLFLNILIKYLQTIFWHILYSNCVKIYF